MFDSWVARIQIQEKWVREATIIICRSIKGVKWQAVWSFQGKGWSGILEQRFLLKNISCKGREQENSSKSWYFKWKVERSWCVSQEKKLLCWKAHVKTKVADLTGVLKAKFDEK